MELYWHSYLIDDMHNLYTYELTRSAVFCQHSSLALLCAPSCYLILELLIGVHYDYLFLLSEIFLIPSIL